MLASHNRLVRVRYAVRYGTVRVRRGTGTVRRRGGWDGCHVLAQSLGGAKVRPLTIGGCTLSILSEISFPTVTPLSLLSALCSTLPSLEVDRNC